MQQTAVEQHLHQRLDAADVDELGHRVLAARPQVREHRHPLADAREVVQRELHARGACDGEHVQHGVGGTAERDDDRDRVLEGLARQDAARRDAGLDEPDHRLARAAAVVALALTDRLLRGAVGQREPERLDRGGHGVRGVHAAAAAGTRDGGSLDLGELLVAHLPRRMAADRLEHRDDVAALRTGPDGAAVDEHGRPIEPRHGDRAGGHVLVAAAERDEPVEALRSDHGLDRVGDDLARDQRIAHAGRTHRDAVGDGDGVEQHGLAARGVDAALGLGGELVEMHVAGREVRPARGDADLRPSEVRVGEPHRAQHRPGRRLLRSVDDQARPAPRVDACGGFLHGLGAGRLGRGHLKFLFDVVWCRVRTVRSCGSVSRCVRVSAGAPCAGSAPRRPTGGRDARADSRRTGRSAPRACLR